jgi:hypothetical protein
MATRESSGRRRPADTDACVRQTVEYSFVMNEICEPMMRSRMTAPRLTANARRTLYTVRRGMRSILSRALSRTSTIRR